MMLEKEEGGKKMQSWLLCQLQLWLGLEGFKFSIFKFQALIFRMCIFFKSQFLDTPKFYHPVNIFNFLFLFSIILFIIFICFYFCLLSRCKLSFGVSTNIFSIFFV